MSMVLGSPYIQKMKMRRLACVSEHDEKQDREGGAMLANWYDRRRQLRHPQTDALR